MPTTGALTSAPTVTQTVINATAQVNGFIVTSAGMSENSAFIIDTDGAVVWHSVAPTQCSRARMDYEGVNMWMLSLNVGNRGGEMRFVSMDGQASKTNIAGLSGAHHDFTVLPGKIVAMVWSSTGIDPESNLVEITSDGLGSAKTIFKIGSNLYLGGMSAMGGQMRSRVTRFSTIRLTTALPLVTAILTFMSKYRTLVRFCGSLVVHALVCPRVRQSALPEIGRSITIIT